MSKRSRQYESKGGVRPVVAGSDVGLVKPASGTLPGADLWGGWLLIGAAVVLAAVLMAHWSGLHAGALSFDDPEYLTGNQLVRHPSAASTWRFLSEVLEPSTVHGYYQPLTMISLMVDYALGGRPDHLFEFHRTSLLLHMANTLLVMVLLYRLFGDPVAAGVVGLLFGVHPLAVETVVWVGERKTVLAAFFALLSLGAYLRYVRSQGRWAYGASLAAFVLALMSKPTVTPLPVCLLLLDWWPLKRPVLTRRVIIEKVPFLLIALVSAIVTFESQRRTASALLPGEQASQPIAYMICHNIVFYLWKIVCPIRLSSHYPLPEPSDLSSPAVAAGVLGTIVLVALLVVSLRRTRALVAGWLFFFVAIFPTLGIVGFTNVVASDKYAYWPSFGLMVIAAWLVSELRSRDRTRAWGPATKCVLAVVVPAAIALGVATSDYLRDWRNTETLCLRMLAMAPDAPAPLSYLGCEYNRQGRYAEAIPCLRRVTERAPRYSGAFLQLGDALQHTGDLPGAIAAYRQAIALKADHVEAYNNLGNVLLAVKDVEGAVKCYEKVIELVPGQADSHYNLANVLAQCNQPEKAITHYRQAIGLQPGHAAAHKNLAMLLWPRKEIAAALEQYEAALRYQPADWQVAGFLAEFYAGAKEPAFHKPERAIELARQAVATTAKLNQVAPRLGALVVMSRVYRWTGHEEDAAAAARTALELAQATGDPKVVPIVQARLAAPGPAGSSQSGG